MNKNLTYVDAFAKKGIHIIIPQDGEPGTVSGPVTQAEIIARTMPEICEETKSTYVLWDTMTADAARGVREIAQTGLHQTKTSKNFLAKDGNEIALSVKAGDWRDYGFVQERMRKVRETIINHPARQYHFACAMHQETSTKNAGVDKDGNQLKTPVMHGPNAGGPASVEHWGKEFQWGVHRIFSEGEGDKMRRKLQLQPGTDSRKIPFVARTNTGGGVVKPIQDVPTTLEGCVKLWHELLDATGDDLTNPLSLIDYCLYGIMGVGKTFWLASFFAALRERVEGANMVYVASDGGSQRLRSFPQQLRK